MFGAAVGGGGGRGRGEGPRNRRAKAAGRVKAGPTPAARLRSSHGPMRPRSRGARDCSGAEARRRGPPTPLARSLCPGLPFPSHLRDSERPARRRRPGARVHEGGPRAIGSDKQAPAARRGGPLSFDSRRGSEPYFRFVRARSNGRVKLRRSFQTRGLVPKPKK